MGAQLRFHSVQEISSVQFRWARWAKLHRQVKPGSGCAETKRQIGPPISLPLVAAVCVCEVPLVQSMVELPRLYPEVPFMLTGRGRGVGAK